MSDPRLRIIKIKTGVVKRLYKDKIGYEKESVNQRTKVQTLKDQGKDEYDIRKQEEVLQESLMMIPDCQRRLVKAFEELKNILDSEEDLKEDESYLEALKVLKEVESLVPKEEEVMTLC